MPRRNLLLREDYIYVLAFFIDTKWRHLFFYKLTHLEKTSAKPICAKAAFVYSNLFFDSLFLEYH